MFKLSDFDTLPQLDPLMAEMIADGPGLMILAGIESRAGIEARQAGEETLPGEVFLPSGLSAMFDVLIQTILEADPNASALVVAREKSLARVPRRYKQRIKLLPVEGGQSYDRQVEFAVQGRPALLVIDRLTSELVTAALYAAQQGLKVLTSLDTALRGAGVARQLLDLGAPPEALDGLRWVVTMQRLPELCPHCKRPAAVNEGHYRRVRQRYPHLAETARGYFGLNGGKLKTAFARAEGCEHCHSTGRKGDVAVFDVFQAQEKGAGEPGLDQHPLDLALFETPSRLSLEEYVLHLAAQGRLDLQDLLWLESSQLRRTYTLLSTSERALAETGAALSRKLFELEASNRVLVQRTEVLMSLEDLGQALIASVDLAELAKRVCRRAGELCGADRVILYLQSESEAGAEQAEVLALRGWEGAQVQRVLPGGQVFGSPSETKVARFVLPPPGVTPQEREGDQAEMPILSGLRVPLVSQERLVGMMVVQSTQKGFFTPGETALLQTFANQAALAIQRAGLVDDLLAKIAELEAAQAELVMKERMERELELARQVQQSMLPRTFPRVAGFNLAARNEPARQVGGDFYDMIWLDADHFGIVMGDVSDKGMPAALYMVLTRTLLLAEARREPSPQAALEGVNRLLLELGDLDGFVSVFYGVVENSTRRMRFARAGHEKPWLLRAGQVIRLEGQGMVLGVLESDQLRLTEEEVQLAVGDRLVLYTDGLTDATNPRGQFFGAERLGPLLASCAGQDANGMCEAIFSALEHYRAELDPFDDMTLMILEVE